MTVGIGTRLDDRYELVALIARGGMGAVYRAHDDRLGRDVAVKVLDGGLAADHEFLARFQREARAAASLNHPGIVGVFDRGEHEGSHYTVMELVDGPSLADVLRAEGAFEPERALALAAAIADALGAAHRVGVVHRDIKPSNVLVTPSGGVKVTDFGIARSTTDVTLTATDSVLGSIPYVAPEQVRGEPATPASDVYGLGCLLYALLTGRPPFTGDVAVSVLHQHLSEEPTPPSSLAGEVPEHLDAVVARLLAKDPEHRPRDGASAAELLRGPDDTWATRVLPVVPPEVLERTRVLGALGDDGTRVLPEDFVFDDEASDDGAPDESAPLRWGPRVAALIALLALVLAVALYGDRFASSADDLLTPTESPQPAAPTVPTEPTSPSPDPEPEPSPDSVGSLIEEIGGLLSSGRGTSMDGDAAEKLAEKLFKVVQEVGEGDWKEARKKARELRQELDKRTRDGDVTAERSAALEDAIDRLEALLPRADDDD